MNILDWFKEVFADNLRALWQLVCAVGTFVLTWLMCDGVIRLMKDKEPGELAVFLCLFLFCVLLAIIDLARRKRLDLPLLISLFFAAMMAAVLGFAFTYHKLGIETPDDAPYTMSDCFHVSLSTWTTLGYTDYRPSLAARGIAGIEAMAGYIYMAFGMGVIVSVLLPPPNEKHDASGGNSSEQTTNRAEP